MQEELYKRLHLRMPHAGDETYIHLPANKEFYVFTTSVIEPNRASVVAYGNKRKRRRCGSKSKQRKLDHR